MALMIGLPLLSVAQTRVLNEYSKAKKITSSIPENRVNNAGLRTTAYDGIHHLVGLHIDGGYSALLSTYPVLSSSPGGYGLGFGLDYAYLHKKLIVQTGLSFRWQDVSNYVRNDSIIVPGLVDSDNKTPFTLRYDFTNQTDQARTLYVQLPILVGTYFGGFYFLLGTKLSMALAGNSVTHTTISTTGTYNRYIDILEEMDNHGFRKEVEEHYTGDRLKLRFDIMAYGELGYEWEMSNYGKKGYKKQTAKDRRFRLSAFAEVGLMNICPRTDNERYIIPESTRYDFSTFTVNPVASTKDMWDFKLHNLTAGIKLSFFFFGIQTTEKCILCGALGDEIRMKE